MSVREQTRATGGARSGDGGVPAVFTAACAAMRAARLRPEILCEDMPAPQRIAPYAAALSADVTIDETDVATGRLILLHDPDGNDAWGGGTFRCVAYVRADVELELVSDSMVGEVAWSWLGEALDAHEASYVAPSGTVTRVATESFGGMSGDEPTAQVEVRASWTPQIGDGSEIAQHVEAWGQLLCTAAGLPPVPDGVAVMPTRRGQRGPA